MKPSPLLPLLCLATLGFAGPAFAADAPIPGPAPAEVVLFNHDQVEQTFARGFPFNINTEFKVQAGHRQPGGPYAVEVHTRDTDIFYILEGTATFVTGGTAVDAKEVRPNEVTAKTISGGTERHLEKGDVIIIPRGIPHQFIKVDGQFEYFVVKVTK